MADKGRRREHADVEADRAAPEEAVGVDLRRDGAAALEWAASYLERVGELPVLAQVAPGEIRDRLPDAPPEQPEPFADVLRDLDEVLLPGITHWQSPRFFAYFATTGSEPGILAELLIAALNNVGFLWRTSPALAELEEVTLSWLGRLLGLPDAWHGHIEDTASTVTMAALIAAREARSGARAVLASEQAHSSVEKACRMLDLELRKVPTDDDLRMRADGLELSDACAVVATVGTTSSAAVDPVPALADACERAGAWLHVDAAYAGSAWSCEELRWSAVGVDRASSLVVNPHKWLFVPMDCSAFWCSRPDELRNAFSLVPEYLRVSEEVASLSEYGPALGRRFRALKLWAVMRCLGAEGIRARIREAVRLAELLASLVRDEPGWEVLSRNFSLVCFRRGGDDAENEALLERANATGEIFISHTRLHDRYWLRLAVGSARTTEADVRRAWEVLRRCAQ
jgi:aromatic-L-amino-acid/L-tryptophan decarboxylase